MSTSTLQHTVLPPEESLDDLHTLLSSLETSAVLTAPNGKRLLLPPEVFTVLREVVEAMAQGKAVTVAPVHQRLTTQQAASLLGISRPTLVKLLENGEIPFEQPGRHRKLRLSDVLEYQKHRSTQTREALDRMVEISRESGIYEQTATPQRTR